MTERRFDPLRPVLIVLAVGAVVGLVGLIFLFGARKRARRRQEKRLTVLRGAVAKALLRDRKPGEVRNAA
jgi:hypothetical protein